MGFGEFANPVQRTKWVGFRQNNDFDRKAVKLAGYTDAEADCRKLLAEAAGKFFALPVLHPMDKEEVANAHTPFRTS